MNMQIHQTDVTCPHCEAAKLNNLCVFGSDSNGSEQDADWYSCPVCGTDFDWDEIKHLVDDYGVR